ncbi:hypothetical protein [Oceanospirillum sanctuarii]|uniref:hypothetical protein n=1 Tax=Oceanospirillum sanctuarii TaxID=1434821 RepID=UPI00111E1EB9|nr:hypothetical protein [Oceanospirillum sanctuarii]
MKKQQTGMTLIEILIIVLVVSVGMAATAKFQGDLLQSGATTKARTQALAFVQNEIETLRMNHGVAAAGSQDDVAGSNASYDVSWSVTALAGLANTDQYTATVAWNDNQNRAQSVQLGTVLYADRMLGGGTADNVVRSEAAQCVFSDCSSEDEESNPDIEVTVDINGEEQVVITDVVDGLDITEDGLSQLGKKDTTLTGNDFISKLNGSGSFSATNGNDKFLIQGKANGSVYVNMRGGNDILQIGDELTGSADINMGSGDDLLILGNIGGSATVDGGAGTDTLCFTDISQSQFDGASLSIRNFELLLFNDGSYLFQNGYSIPESSIPVGCGSSGQQQDGYRYPVTVKILFTSAADAEKDSVADIFDSSTLVDPVPDDPADGTVYLDFYQDNHYFFYLNELTAVEEDIDDGSGSTVTRFVKTLSFDIQSQTQLLATNQIFACSAWTGDNKDQLEITMQDSECTP